MRRRFAAALVAPGFALGGYVAAKSTSAWPEMGHAQPGHALLNYQEPHVELVKSRRDQGGSDDALDGAAWDRRQVIMRDGRKERLTLDDNGFQLLDAKKNPDDDYYNEQTVIGPYYRECEELLKQVTGASFVKAFDHNVRCTSGNAAGRKLKGGNLVQAPAGIVHGDYTIDSAPRRFKLLGEPPKLNDPLRPVLGETPLIEQTIVDDALSGRRRYAFVNVWRPISKIEQKPLACADAASVKEEDLIVFQIVYKDRIGENYFAKWRAEHKWCYFPSMTPDEALLIKQWDSHGTLAPAKGGKSTFALHTAFLDPASPEDAADRESIEVRLVLVW